MQFSRVRRRIVVASVSASLLVVLIYVTTIGWVLAHERGSAHLPAECGIVFGATVHVVWNEAGTTIIGSEAGPGIRRRIDTAIDLYQKGLIHRLFLTGGKGEGMIQSEAEVMRRLAVRSGVRAGDIVTEPASRSTKENLEDVRPLVATCSSVIGISDGYHLARIEFLARQQGWNLTTYPSEVQTSLSFETASVLREAAGILYYMVLR
ncbi:YdcF family protein [Candidatus Peregrinibacteria bacterium]|nr:YdcF family protein [Candidatus Peregrinibacteria bacterium]